MHVNARTVPPAFSDEITRCPSCLRCYENADWPFLSRLTSHSECPLIWALPWGELHSTYPRFHCQVCQIVLQSRRKLACSLDRRLRGRMIWTHAWTAFHPRLCPPMLAQTIFNTWWTLFINLTPVVRSQTQISSFSSVSTPMFAAKHALESSWRDLQIWVSHCESNRGVNFEKIENFETFSKNFSQNLVEHFRQNS